MDMQLDQSKFLGVFREEAEEHIQQLNRGLLALENHPENESVLQEIARSAHTLKGSSKMMGFDEITRIAHKMEDLLTAARDRELNLEEPALDLLFQSLDAISTLVDAAVTGEAAEVQIDSLCEMLEKASEGAVLPGVTAEPARAETEEKADKARGISVGTITEMKESLEELNQGVLSLENNLSEPAVLKQVQAIAHGLTELSERGGWNAIAQIAQRIEEILNVAELRALTINGEIIDLLFQGLGFVDILLNTAETGEENDLDVTVFCEILEGVIHHVPVRHTGPAPETDAAPTVSPSGRGDAPSEEDLRQYEETLKVKRETREKEDARAPKTPHLNAATGEPVAALQKKETTAVDKTPSTEIEEKKAPLAATATEGAVIEETIRVGTTQLDSLANIVGEMIVSQISAKNQLTRFREIVNTQIIPVPTTRRKST